MTHSLRERRKALLRDEILEATHLLMAERGYAALSMEELAARVGVSKPTLYSQFPTKEDLVAAMATQLMERVFTDVAAAAPGRSPLERLMHFLHTTVRLQVERRTTAMQLFLPEVLTILERNAASRAQICRNEELVMGLLREAVAAGEIDPATDLASVARLLYALLIAPSMGRLSQTETPDPQVMADTFVTILRRGLAGPPPGGLTYPSRDS